SCIVWSARGDHHVVYRSGQLVEESGEAIEVSRVECRAARCIDLDRGVLETFRVPACEYNAGSLGAGSSGGLHSDSGAPADHDNGLPEERLRSNVLRACACGSHFFLRLRLQEKVTRLALDIQPEISSLFDEHLIGV